MNVMFKQFSFIAHSITPAHEKFLQIKVS